MVSLLTDSTYLVNMCDNIQFRFIFIVIQVAEVDDRKRGGMCWYIQQWSEAKEAIHIESWIHSKESLWSGQKKNLVSCINFSDWRSSYHVHGFSWLLGLAW